MLDVTMSPITSLYFSCWHGTGDFAIWEFHDDRSFAQKLLREALSFITPTRYIDERIKAQSGGFIRQNLAGCSFEEALSETMCIESLVYMNKGGVLSRGTPYDDVVCKESKVIKWIFPREQRGAAKDLLLLRGHVGESIFPDISGVVESIMAEVSAKVK